MKQSFTVIANFFHRLTSYVSQKYSRSIVILTTSITRSFHIFMLSQSGWQITTFSHKIYIFGFHLLEAILKVKSTCKILVYM